MGALSLPSYRVRVSPPVLAWARETAGLSLEDAGRLSHVNVGRLEAWEAGNDAVDPPTVSQLRTLSNLYKRPISLFLLKAPPAERLARAYARRLHGASAEAGSHHLRFAVRDAVDQRVIMLELLGELGEEPPELQTVRVQDDPETTADSIRQILDVSDDDVLAWASESASLQQWIDTLDAGGVLVVQYRYVAVDERRGFAIVETPLPVIALNESDARVGRLFTLLHEFAHIQRAANRVDIEDEAWCNAVAAATLVPARLALAHIDEVATSDWLELGLSVAAHFGVSRETAYRRLATLGVIADDQYRTIRADLLADPKSGGGGIARYPTGQVRRLGRRYIRVVGEAYDRGSISLHEASRYLGVQGRYVEPLVEAAEKGGAQ